MTHDGAVITGIGIVSARGSNAASIWERLNENPAVKAKKSEGELDFTLDIPASQLRRVNRYSRLALAGTTEAQKDAGIAPDDALAFRRGSIFTTGYGSVVSNVKFAESVAKGDTDSCSPTLFSGTVANSGVGQVCTHLNLKGPSTVLIGGNVFVYSKLLLETKKADVVFTGAVEEYSRDLWDSLAENETASCLNVNEAAVVMTLERAGEADKRSRKTYCALGNGLSAALGGFPVIQKIDPDAAALVIRRTIAGCAEKNRDAGNVDVVFSSSCGSYFDKAETEAIEKEFPRSFIVGGVKDFFGETLGCAFSLNVAAAALCIKNKSIPRSLNGGAFDNDFRNVLATGFDPAGNYHCLMLRGCE